LQFVLPKTRQNSQHRVFRATLLLVSQLLLSFSARTVSIVRKRSVETAHGPTPAGARGYGARS